MLDFTNHLHRTPLCRFHRRRRPLVPTACTLCDAAGDESYRDTGFLFELLVLLKETADEIMVGENARQSAYSGVRTYFSSTRFDATHPTH